MVLEEAGIWKLIISMEKILLTKQYFKVILISMKIKLVKMNCKRCGHIWHPKKTEIRICPKCKSPYFDRERKGKTSRSIADEIDKKNT